MRLKVPFLRFVLGAIAFSFPLAIFLILLPHLINAEPVKERFIKELRAWTGAPVELHGPVAVESLFSLTLNAEDVEFKGFRGLSSLKSLRAERMVARLAWADLLFGRLDFDKIKVSGAKIRLDQPDGAGDFRALLSLLTKSGETPFESLTLSKSTIEAKRSENLVQLADVDSLIVKLRSRGRLQLYGRVNWAGEPVALNLKTRLVADAASQTTNVPLNFDLSSALLKASFEGTAHFFENWRIQGAASVSSPDTNRLQAWLGERFGQALPELLEVSGTLDADPTRLRLESAEITTNFSRATGDLTVLLGRARPKVDGSLAFRQLDLAALWTLAEAGRTARLGESGLSDDRSDMQIDLGVSATSLSWGAHDLGSAAFTITGSPARLSAEIANLELLGGSMRGHVETDLGRVEPGFRARMSVEGVDAAALSGFGFLTDWLDGRAHAQITLVTQGADRARLMDNARIEGRVNFPDGGQIRFDPAMFARLASGEERAGWNSGGLSWQEFSALQFKLALKERSLTFTDLAVSSEAALVTGEGQVDCTRGLLDWQLSVRSPGDGLSVEGEQAGSASEASDLGNRLSIVGDWRNPSIRALARPDEAAGSKKQATPAEKVTRSAF